MRKLPKLWPKEVEYTDTLVLNPKLHTMLRVEYQLTPYVEIRKLKQSHPAAGGTSSNSHARGLFAVAPFSVGELIGHYAGLVKERRPGDKSPYLFSFVEEGRVALDIDAGGRGSVCVVVVALLSILVKIDTASCVCSSVLWSFALLMLLQLHSSAASCVCCSLCCSTQRNLGTKLASSMITRVWLDGPTRDSKYVMTCAQSSVAYEWWLSERLSRQCCSVAQLCCWCVVGDP